MINSSEYKDSYELYLAELSITQNIPYYLIKCIEENNVTILSEGVKETVTNYIDKVTTSTQKNWDKFKLKVNNDKQRKYLRENTVYINKFKWNFTINGFPNYSANNLTNLKIMPFDYNRMKNTLETKQDFLENYYKQYISKEFSFKQMIDKSILINTVDTTCEKKLLIKLHNFLLEGVSSLIQSIEQDITTLNASNNNIIRTVNSIVSTEESYNLFNEIYTSITEASPKMTFVDPNGEKTETGRKKKNKHTDYVNAIYNYMKVSTDIISEKMRATNDIYSCYYNVIKHAVDYSKKNGGEINNSGSMQKKTTKTNIEI